MKQIMDCYRNWHIDFILLLGVLALLLVSAESEGFLANITGIALAAADFLIVRKWHADGKLQELDKITE